MIRLFSFLIWALHGGCKHVTDIRKGKAHYTIYIYMKSLNTSLEDYNTRLDELNQIIQAENMKY